MPEPPPKAQTEHLAKAERLMAEGAYEPAHALCMAVLSVTPEAAGAWFLLGVLAADHDNPGKAAELFGRAAALDLADARAPAHLARCLMTLNRRDEALAHAQAAEARRPVDAETLDILGGVFSRAGLQDRALSLFEAAVALAPAQASYVCHLAAARQLTGDLAGAEAAYAQALALDRALYCAWSARVQLRPQTLDANFLAELEAQFAVAGADGRLHLGHALAKTHEDLGNPATALDWLIKAKAAKRRQVGYDPRADADLFAAAQATYPDRSPRPGKGPSDRPIFLVGLPGTGAALVARILSSHPEVTSVGGRPGFGQILQRMAGSPVAFGVDEATLEAASQLDLRKAGAVYLQSHAALVPGQERVVDGAPLNILFAGLIHRALPNARIIVLRRHPMDAGLASFRRLFPSGSSEYDYAYDLAHTGAYCAGFDRLIAHWRMVLPADRFTELAYEDLVADPKGQTRRLLDFCGLDVNSRGHDFHETVAPMVAGRSPIHASSIGRWRRYGSGLAPLRAALEANGLAVRD